MASSLPTEKLDRNNYASWSYKMHQYLLGHGYWSYVVGANDTTPKSIHRDFPTWEQSTSRVLYCFVSSVGEQLLSYIRDAKTPKDAWGNLKRFSPQAPQPGSFNSDSASVLSVADYTSNIKDICDSLAFIDVNIEEGEMV